SPPTTTPAVACRSTTTRYFSFLLFSTSLHLTISPRFAPAATVGAAGMRCAGTGRAGFAILPSGGVTGSNGVALSPACHARCLEVGEPVLEQLPLVGEHPEVVEHRDHEPALADVVGGPLDASVRLEERDGGGVRALVLGEDRGHR